MERFGRNGGEFHEFERRRIIEGQLLPHFDEALEIARRTMPLSRASGVEVRERQERDLAAEQMKELVLESLELRQVNKRKFIEKHDDLAHAQQKISNMRADVAKDIGLRFKIDQLSGLYQLNNEAAASFYRDDTDDEPDDPVLKHVKHAFTAHGAIIGVLDDLLHIEDEPADRIGMIRHYVNNLSSRRYKRDQLLFLDRIVDLLHMTISDGDGKIQNTLQQGSYQYVMSGAYEKLRQSVAQLRENL